MNAIILAAGKSSRMYKSGANIPKGLLPILGIPNIERTILMLHMLDIYEIVIAVPYRTTEFDYLIEKYSCTVFHIPPENMNTLTTMNYLIEYIDDSFIIESDVVCAKNIFRVFDHSTYYVMKYAYPESDEWNVVTDSNDNIISFEIGTHSSPAIFGISFWKHKDCDRLKEYLKRQMQNDDTWNTHFFWDDHIDELLDNIYLKIHEITSDMACEMNTITEYQYGIQLCQKMLINPTAFWEKIFLRKNNNLFYIQYSEQKEKNKQWLKKLFAYYGEVLDIDTSSHYNTWYNPEESVFIIRTDTNIEIGFFSFIIQSKYILLRRLFIDSHYRTRGIGKKILNYMRLFTISLKKELRVNVYDENAAAFYKHLGAEKLFSTYHWHLI